MLTISFACTDRDVNNFVEWSRTHEDQISHVIKVGWLMHQKMLELNKVLEPVSGVSGVSVPIVSVPIVSVSGVSVPAERREREWEQQGWEEYKLAMGDMKSMMSREIVELRQQLVGHLSDSQIMVNKHLQQRVEEQEKQLQLYRKCNHAKGLMGEQIVSQWIRQALPHFSVEQKAEEAQMSDIHAVGPQQLLLFECKNKKVITTQDVDKFIRDIGVVKEQTVTPLWGAMFVSLQSRNIPHKGAFHIEWVHQIPVIYVGMDDAMQDTYMQRMIELLYALGEHHAQEQSDSYEAILDGLKPCLMQLYQLQSLCAKQKAHMKSWHANLIEMEQECNSLYQTLLSLVGEEHEVKKRKLERLERTCNKCQRQYKTEATYLKHISSCK